MRAPVVPPQVPAGVATGHGVLRALASPTVGVRGFRQQYCATADQCARKKRPRTIGIIAMHAQSRKLALMATLMVHSLA